MADVYNIAPPKPRRLRRRLLVGSGVVLLVAALVFTPPLININRLQKRIASSMSASLGRTVRMEGAQLHLLPTPGFTLNYIVINEDPAFGNEPTIRADQVEAQLRISSLWRHQVEFSQISFINPSVNLVRDASGRWNIEDILIHASRISAAPTGQKTASEQPRFPYIEATGARVNFKLGEEKIPFSLDEADFALWLPSPQQWRVRIEAKPLRTDSNLGGTGTMRLEGVLERADRLGEVPVDLKASWQDAPLGEASRLLTGNDANWRGTLHLNVNVTGRLNSATLKTQLTLNNLRLADFVPSQMLDVTMNCATGIDIPALKLAHSACTIPDGDPTPLVVTSEAADLMSPEKAPLHIDDDKLSSTTAFAWLRLLSQRLPSTTPDATLAIHLNRPADTPFWQGNVALSLPASATDPQSKPQTLLFNAQRNASTNDAPACLNSLDLAPTPVRLDANSNLTLTGDLTACGYRWHATGTTTSDALSTAMAPLPMLGDSLAPLLPVAQAAPVDLSCSSLWDTPQSCIANHPAPAARSNRRAGSHHH